MTQARAIHPVRRIAAAQWRALLRDRVAVTGLVLTLLLALVAAVSATAHQHHVAAERQRHQAHVDGQFQAQPDRHPHRVAHYGHFLFRPLDALAAFDPGIDPYTGHTLFIEAHRQNSANFGDVRQSSLLLRFGQLTPAFVLQVLAPLLLVFVGHACVARERESGTLRVLLAQGVTGRQIVAGKLLALSGFAAIELLPALLLLGWLVLDGQAGWVPATLLAAGHAAWLLLWALAIVTVSAACARGRDALLSLLAIWALVVIALPRWAPDLAATTLPLPTRFESEIEVRREYLALGDAHDPSDPKFAEFRARVLREYGVGRIEDLPVNFKGLVGAEGERQSSELFERHATAGLDLQQRQLRVVDGFGWLSPALALRRLSMVASGTDLHTHRRFLEQGEAYRYALVQRLNRLQADELSYTDDTNPDRENRIDHAHWQSMPAFRYEPEPVARMLAHAAPALAMLAVWLGALAGLAAWRAGRLERGLR